MMREPLPQPAPTLESWTTENGMRVVYAARHAIPIVDINIDLQAGSCYDPPGKAGVSEMLASLLLTGQKRHGDLPAMREEEVENAFDDIGAKVTADAHVDRIAIGMRVLSQPVLLERALTLLSAALVTPSWAARPFERERERLLAFAEEQLSDPEQLCTLRLTQALYDRHPYGIAATEASIDAIERRDVIAFHGRVMVRERAIVTLIGDLSRADAQRIAETLSMALPSGTPVEPMPRARERKAVSKTIEHPASQAHIAIGTRVPGAADPDYVPLMLANQMFAWRLNEVVREQLGLAYEVSSTLFPSRFGEHRIVLKTRSDQATQALEAVRGTLRTFVEGAGGDDDAEFQRTRTELIEGRALSLDSNAKLLRQAADLAFEDLPLHYLDDWTERIAAVTLPEAMAAFARWITPERQQTVVIGGVFAEKTD
jgi:zinc protease